MSEIVLSAIISGVLAAIGVAIPAIRAIRKQPTKRTTDQISLVDASGTVIGNLTDEIARLDTALDEARLDASSALSTAADAQSELDKIRHELKKRPTRDELLADNEVLTLLSERLRSQLLGEGIIPKNGE